MSLFCEAETSRLWSGLSPFVLVPSLSWQVIVRSLSESSEKRTKDKTRKTTASVSSLSWEIAPASSRRWSSCSCCSAVASEDRSPPGIARVPSFSCCFPLSSLSAAVVVPADSSVFTSAVAVAAAASGRSPFAAGAAGAAAGGAGGRAGAAAVSVPAPAEATSAGGAASSSGAAAAAAVAAAVAAAGIQRILPAVSGSSQRDSPVALLHQYGVPIAICCDNIYT